MEFKQGDIVRFKEAYAYDDYCPHCGSEIKEWIGEGEERDILKTSKDYITLYECHMDIEDAKAYLEIVKG
jgi:energy-converting hydrogenase A subunit M